MHSNLNKLSKLKPHKKIILIKIAVNEVSVWIYRTFSWICVLGINALNGQSCTRTEPALPSSAERQQLSALAIRP